MEAIVRVSLLLWLGHSLLTANASPLQLAREMVDRVAVDSNAYTHRPLVWQLPETGPACFRGDCSGLLVLTFREAFGWNGASFRSNTGAERPLAKHLFDAVGPGRAFLPVMKVDELRAGDWVFVRYQETNAGRDTGHVMLVAADFSADWGRSATPPILPGARQYSLPIIDSTIGPHGAGDSREGRSTNGGIGRGNLRLYASGDGIPLGYAWSLSERSIYRDASRAPLRLARLSPSILDP
ncbi:MAG: hypothetical protein J0L75_05860 [Spirochaetes bacterium]|nr:hypothetical protein [Spirochaetota bacterium]